MRSPIEQSRALPQRRGPDHLEGFARWKRGARHRSARAPTTLRGTQRLPPMRRRSVASPTRETTWPARADSPRQQDRKGPGNRRTPHLGQARQSRRPALGARRDAVYATSLIRSGPSRVTRPQIRRESPTFSPRRENLACTAPAVHHRARRSQTPHVPRRGARALAVEPRPARLVQTDHRLGEQPALVGTGCKLRRRPSAWSWSQSVCVVTTRPWRRRMRSRRASAMWSRHLSTATLMAKSSEYHPPGLARSGSGGSLEQLPRLHGTSAAAPERRGS